MYYMQKIKVGNPIIVQRHCISLQSSIERHGYIHAPRVFAGIAEHLAEIVSVLPEVTNYAARDSGTIIDTWKPIE
jgi:hypothetical protein